MSEVYAGLDVSDKKTHICLMDREGKVHWRGAVASDPVVLAATLRRQAVNIVPGIGQSPFCSRCIIPEKRQKVRLFEQLLISPVSNSNRQ